MSRNRASHFVLPRGPRFAGVIALAFAVGLGCTLGCTKASRDGEAKPVPSTSAASPAPSSPDGASSAESPPAPEKPALASTELAAAIDQGDRARHAALVEALPQSEEPYRSVVLGWLALERGDALSAQKHLELAASRGVTAKLADKLSRRGFVRFPTEWTPKASWTPKNDRELLVAFGKRSLAQSAPAAALAEIEKLLGAFPRKDKSSLRTEAELRLLALEAAQKAERKSEVARHAFWLWENAPMKGEDTTPLLRALPVKARPNAKLTLARAETLSEAGLLERLDATLDAGFARFAPCERATLRAKAIYAARRYEEASKELEKASRLCPKTKPELAFLSARALLRAQKDDAAIAAFDKLATLPKSPFADDAAYQSARATLFQGNADKAVEKYTRYLGKFGNKARHGGEVQFERALASYRRGKSAPLRDWAKATATRKKSDGDLEELLAARLTLELESKDDARRTALRALEHLSTRQPLTLAGLLARDLLDKNGGAPHLPQVPRLAPIAAMLPEVAAESYRLGGPDLAEIALEVEESSVRTAFGARSTEALCQLYGSLESGRRRYQLARANIPAARLGFPIHADRAWAYECSYPTTRRALVESLTKESGVTPALLYGVLRQESAFDPNALSPVGALGLLQMIPRTRDFVATELGQRGEDVDLRIPEVSLRYGARYLARLLRQFDGNFVLAVAAYNAGPEAVFRWLGALDGAPSELFTLAIPYAETRNYVELVLGNAAHYAFLEGGAPALPRLSGTVSAKKRDGEEYY